MLKKYFFVVILSDFTDVPTRVELSDESTISDSDASDTKVCLKCLHIDAPNDHFDVIDLSTISNSSSASVKTSFNRNRTGGNGETDLKTGLTSKEFVYEYLLNKYHHQSDSISIHWMNENGETSLPYDFLLIENGIKHYIEVKSTRTINQSNEIDFRT